MSDKVEVKSDKCLLVGYPKETTGYQFYKILEQKLFVSKHTVFLEREREREREREFLLREDTRSKGELGESQSAQTDVGQLT